MRFRKKAIKLSKEEQKLDAKKPAEPQLKVRISAWGAVIPKVVP